MKTLKPVTRSPPEELKDLSAKVRELADRIDNGEVLSLAWSATLTNDKYEVDWVKARGISKVTMIGGATLLMIEMGNNSLKD